MDTDKLILIGIIITVILFMFLNKNQSYNQENFEDERVESQIGLKHIYCDSKYCAKGSIHSFLNEEPAKKYQELLKEFGEPTIFADEPNGIAIWKSPDIFEEIAIRDEVIKHMSPKPHCDYLYTTIRLHVPKEILGEVLSISKTISYDQQKQELTVRCNSMGSNVATIYLVLKFINNPVGMTLVDIQKDFDKIVTKAKHKWNYKIIYDELKTMLRDHQLKYADSFLNKKCK